MLLGLPFYHRSSHSKLTCTGTMCHCATGRALKPVWPKGYVRLAAAFRALSRFDEEVEALTTALDQCAPSSAMHTQLATALGTAQDNALAAVAGTYDAVALAATGLQQLLSGHMGMFSVLEGDTQALFYAHIRPCVMWWVTMSDIACEFQLHAPPQAVAAM